MKEEWERIQAGAGQQQQQLLSPSSSSIPSFQRVVALLKLRDSSALYLQLAHWHWRGQQR